jgi:hypothetical protein
VACQPYQLIRRRTASENQKQRLPPRSRPKQRLTPAKPPQRVTAKRPGRVGDSDIPQRDEMDALMCTSGYVGAPGSNPWDDPACEAAPDGHELRRSSMNLKVAKRSSAKESRKSTAAERDCAFRRSSFLCPLYCSIFSPDGAGKHAESCDGTQHECTGLGDGGHGHCKRGESVVRELCRERVGIR